MTFTRRNILNHLALTPVAIGAVGSSISLLSENALANVAPLAKIGSATGNDPAGYVNFGNWFGRRPQLAQLYFNQTSPSALSSSISYICQQGKAFMADGAQILWSVPCPGARQLEEIVSGYYNSLYTKLFQSILAVSPNNNTPIFVRLPWEFNLRSQENAALDKNGSWNAALFVAAWRHIATLARGISSRFVRIWCPNVNTQNCDPALCWPGASYVEIVSQDFYMQKAYNKPGDLSWFMNEQRGLTWGKNLAMANGKPFALSEWGMDSDIFVNDFNIMALWMQGLGSQLHHHCWWNRPEVINCVLTDGSHLKLAAAYKQKFA